MSALALLAHSDPHGLVAPHVLRSARELHAVADRVVVVSSAPLRPEAAEAISGVAELLRRPGTGGHWVSWRAGLDAAGDWRGLSRLVLAHDGVVGPLRPLTEVLGDARPGMLRGITATGPHLHRYLLDVGRDVLRDPVLHAFWTGVAPAGPSSVSAADPELLERNLSRAVAAAGWQVRPYFCPRATDRARATTRVVRRALGQALTKRGERRAAAVQTLRHPPVQLLDPTVAWWYRALDGRLPYVRLDVLATDPDRVGRERMLRALEQRYPEQMEGVRAYLARTALDDGSAAPTTQSARGAAR